MLVVLLGVIGFLVTRLGQKGTAHTLQLVTLRPRNIVTLGEYRIPALQYAVGILFGVIQVSLFALLFALKAGSPFSGTFWLLFGEIALSALVLFGLHCLLMYWISSTFSDPGASRLWLSNVSILFILFGASLAIPIPFLAFSDLSPAVAGGLAALFYLVYRTWFLVRGLSIMPKLMRAPLLIILYLCVCELAPLYLAFGIVTHL